MVNKRVILALLATVTLSQAQQAPELYETGFLAEELDGDYARLNDIPTVDIDGK